MVQHDQRLGRGDQRLRRPGRGRRAGLQHDLGAVPRQPRRIAHQELARGEDPAGVGCVHAEPRGWLGQDGPPEQRPERDEGERARRRPRPDRDHAPAAREALEERVQRGRRGVGVGLGPDRRPVAAGGAVDGLPFGHERLVERRVEVRRPGRRAERRLHRTSSRVAARRRRRPPWRASAVPRRRARTGRTCRPASIVWFAPVPRSRGGRSAVSRIERRPRLRGLDDRGEQLGDGGAARGDDGCRDAARLRDPEGEERARALVQVDVDQQAVIARARERERGRSRPRREAHVADAAGHERVDRRRGARQGRRRPDPCVTSPGSAAPAAPCPAARARRPSPDRRPRGRARSR